MLPVAAIVILTFCELVFLPVSIYTKHKMVLKNKTIRAIKMGDIYCVDQSRFRIELDKLCQIQK